MHHFDVEIPVSMTDLRTTPIAMNNMMKLDTKRPTQALGSDPIGKWGHSHG